MDMPFPSTTPRIVDSKWFNADNNPCDEEAELTALEQSNQTWLSSVGQQYKVRTPFGMPNPVGQQYKVRTPFGMPNPESMDEWEECESEEEDGNDESVIPEESHDEDVEEGVQRIYIQLRRQNDPARPTDHTESSELNTSRPTDLNDSSELNTSDQSTLWP